MREAHEISGRRQLLDRVRAEYREMPGLQLTTHQASRLWGLEKQLAAEVLADLCSTGFLQITRKGTFCRAGSG